MPGLRGGDGDGAPLAAPVTSMIAIRLPLIQSS
jgi:hypothetical protein